MSHPSFPEVDAIIREVAAEVIMPRFRDLSAHEISEKKPGDIVTAIDIESERRLTEALIALDPGSRVVGEEATEHDPGVFRALAGDAPVWLVDPLDGTQNFADGHERFAVIVAYCRDGETIAGWIHNPVKGITAWAAAGEGAWMGVERLAAAAPVPLCQMSGSVGAKVRKRLDGRDDAPARLSRIGCVGRDYIDLARGTLHFAHYARRLKPWDHAAGVLLHHEAGGFSALVEDRQPYRPAPHIQYATLLLAPDVATWNSLHAALAGG